MPALPLSACETLETVVILFSLNTNFLTQLKQKLTGKALIRSNVSGP